MGKADLQYKLIKTLAFAPWEYTVKTLADFLGVSQITLNRNLTEMERRGCIFTYDSQGRIFLHQTGWDGFNIKEATLRQMEILRFISAYPNGVKVTEIYSRFNDHKNEKTIGRDLKELLQRQLISNSQGNYAFNANFVIPPIQLDTGEKSLLFEHMAVQQEMSPLKDEAKSLTAKLHISLNIPKNDQDTVIVHGRRPIEDLRRSHFCQRLEECARSCKRILILYRKKEGEVSELELNPLGIMYHWGLDNWYLAAQDNGQEGNIKTYAVDKILTIKELGGNFSRPMGFDLVEWYKYSWGVYRSGKPAKVVIRFHNYYSTINRVKAELSFRETCVLREDNDGMIMEDMVDGLGELAVWLRSFGQGAEVLEPLELREAVIKDLEQIIENYGG
ncbi:WYL domain-containing protein [Desulfosporosinus hippei]|uniref:Predicted DNA-binding transcriptional regulator YafY, contains an HTH and WYL domains n=1 Tax=Desulfosporosinus hippei DSM 8344 TaxID=1121419 RepID=A0A1G8L2M4_9FIRM|nr:WYL domain-containing protein [Desulfosporosinus hippei]SDI49906.1 Predicted DNA-binding transcriptional regulator YafY, contains an HTH and WYL domains [Desulfosporosinus hippei DSM 8344]